MKFEYRSIETTIFDTPLTLEANGYTDDLGNVYITELFHNADNEKYSKAFDDIVNSPALRELLEDKLKEEMS